jgi:hypothetical protein
MQTVFYGPSVTTLASGARDRSEEIKDAAQAAAQVSSVQQGILLRGQAEDLSSRAKGATMKAAAERSARLQLLMLRTGQSYASTTSLPSQLQNF